MRLWLTRRAVVVDAASPLESDARLVDGALRTQVRLRLDTRTISYRGTGPRMTMQLNTIECIEYESYFAKGGIPNGILLRLSAAGRTVEFVLDGSSNEWKRRLPAVECIQ